MSTNSILVVLYAELALFIVGILCPVALRFFARPQDTRKAVVSGDDNRPLVVSRLGT